MQNLLDARDIATVEGLALLAKKVVEGFLAGANRNIRAGQGQEFSQYKGYQPGDDLRQLDWKLLARTDKYYIKESETETNTEITFLLDASASMNYQEHGLSKIHFSRLLTACLAYLANKQGDQLSLLALNSLQSVQLPSRRSATFFNYFLHELLNVKALDTWPAHTGSFLKSGAKKGMVICFSDMYEYKTEITDLLKYYTATGKEVLLFHVLGKKELTLDFGKANTFKDLESNIQIQTNTGKLKKAYTKALTAFAQHLADELLAFEIHYEQISMAQAPHSVLEAYLRKRKKLS